MNLPSPDVYNRITEPNEKRRILTELSHSKGDIVAKPPSPSSSVFPLKATDLNEMLVCPLMPPLPPPMAPSGTIFLSFLLRGEKYFFQGEYKIKQNKIHISIDEPLFHLQRRDDYRLRIPESFQALFEITAINGVMNKISVPMADLSAGGCLLLSEAQKLQLKVGDQIKGHIFLPDRDPIEIVAHFRHTRESQNKLGKLTGIQFSNLTDLQKNRIASLVMDLYREFFLRHP